LVNDPLVESFYNSHRSPSQTAHPLEFVEVA